MRHQGYLSLDHLRYFLERLYLPERFINFALETIVLLFEFNDLHMTHLDFLHSQLRYFEFFQNFTCAFIPQ